MKKNKALAELESIHPYLPGIIREIQDDITAIQKKITHIEQKTR